MTIRGKVALITGATGTIGHAVAAEFLREGAVVALASRTAPNAGGAGEAAAPHLAAKWYPLDLRDMSSVRQAIEQVGRELGPVEILVNAAGVYGPIGPVQENDPAQWAEAVATNLIGAFHLVHAVAPVMARRGGGRIIHFSGGGATCGRPRFSCYSACKAALVRFTESAGKELEKQNIFMNAIAPGPVKSAMWEQLRAAGSAAGHDARKELESMDLTGGVPAERAARLAVLLAETDIPVSGRLISAVWDDWEHLPLHADKVLKSDAWTLRRLTLDGTA